jgi:hypothetical protein
LGLLNEARRFIKAQKPCEIGASSALQFHELLSHPIVADVTFVSPNITTSRSVFSQSTGFSELSADSFTFSEGLAFTDKRLRVASALRRTQFIFSVQERSTFYSIVLSDFIELCQPNAVKILMRIILGDFEKAFSILSGARDTFANIVKLIVIPSISFGHFSSLMQFLHKSPNFLKFFPLRELTEYCKSAELKASLIEIHCSFETYAELVPLLLNFIKSDKSWQKQLLDVTSLMSVCEKALRHSTVEPFQSLLKAAGLQVRFLRVAIDFSLPFDSEMNIFSNNSSSSIEEMAALSLFHKRFNLGLQLIEFRDCNVSTVVDLVLDKLGTTIAEFFKAMKKQMDNVNYEKLCIAMLRGIKERAANERDVPKFILSVVCGIGLQVRSLGELGFVNDAIELCVKEKSVGELNGLLKMARDCGNKSLESRCVKAMSLIRK